MNTTPDFAKLCYRCTAVVRMTAEEFRADPNEHTCCQVCRDKLAIEAGFAGTPVPAAEELSTEGNETKETSP